VPPTPTLSATWQAPTFVASRNAVARGYTLLELMAAVALGGIALALAVPTYMNIMQGQKAQVAKTDLARIALELGRYRLRTGNPPMSLAEMKLDGLLDPWGHPYCYLNFSSTAPGVKGKIRKDHNLHPINSEFDLYSMGPDGDSKAPLTAKASRDDILWARDGAFIGVASDF
jgi:general secretion pathway protein G